MLPNPTSIRSGPPESAIDVTRPFALGRADEALKAHAVMDAPQAVGFVARGNHHTFGYPLTDWAIVGAAP